MVPLKAGDAAAFRKLLNFLIKCQTIEADGLDGHYNPLDTPVIICTDLPKFPLHLQDRWITTHCSLEENIQNNLS